MKWGGLLNWSSSPYISVFSHALNKIKLIVMNEGNNMEYIQRVQLLAALRKIQAPSMQEIKRWTSGGCFAFACALRNKFRFSIKVLVYDDESETLDHAFCLDGEIAVDADGRQPIKKFLKNYPGDVVSDFVDESDVEEMTSDTEISKAEIFLDKYRHFYSKRPIK